MGYVDYDLVVTLLTRRSVLLHYGLVSGQQLIGLQNSGNYRAVQYTVHTQSRSHLRSVICDWLQQLAVTDGLILRSSKSVGLLCSFKFTPAKPLAHLQQNKITGMRLGRIMLMQLSINCCITPLMILLSSAVGGDPFITCRRSAKWLVATASSHE